MMTKQRMLRIFDWILLVVSVLILASAIQLEITGGRSVTWVLIHMIVGVAFFSLIVWHIYQHLQWKAWGKRLWVKSKPLMRWLTAFGILTLVSSFIAGIHWIRYPVHGGIGAVHGKVGFIFIAIVSIHIIRHRRRPEAP